MFIRLTRIKLDNRGAILEQKSIYLNSDNIAWLEDEAEHCKIVQSNGAAPLLVNEAADYIVDVIGGGKPLE